jgi:hypothetical protein
MFSFLTRFQQTTQINRTPAHTCKVQIWIGKDDLKRLKKFVKMQDTQDLVDPCKLLPKDHGQSKLIGHLFSHKAVRARSDSWLFDCSIVSDGVSISLQFSKTVERTIQKDEKNVTDAKQVVTVIATKTDFEEALPQNSVIVMDNLRSHYSKTVDSWMDQFSEALAVTRALRRPREGIHPPTLADWYQFSTHCMPRSCISVL